MVPRHGENRLATQEAERSGAQPTAVVSRGRGGEKMSRECFERLPGAMSLCGREVQTELAEWVEVTPRCWERKLRKWRSRCPQATGDV